MLKVVGFSRYFIAFRNTNEKQTLLLMKTTLTRMNFVRYSKNKRDIDHHVIVTRVHLMAFH